MSRMGELNLTVTELRQCGETITDIADTLEELFSVIGDIGRVEVEPEEPEIATPVESPLALEDVRAVLAEKSRKGHTAEIRALLQKYGADKLSQISSADYKALLADVEALDDAP